MASISKDMKVRYNFLGKSGLLVSNLCLGCMNFGRSLFGSPGNCDEDLSHQMMNRFVEWGGNFFDTADVYGKGHSEEILGRWLASKDRRNFVISTKCYFDISEDFSDAESEPKVNNQGLSRRHISESIEGSLRRLQTDYVDIYMAHLWDYGTPVEETLRTMDDLVRAGKVRYLAFSNLSGWQMQSLVQVAEKLGLNHVVGLQQQYNLVSRWSEEEAFRVCKLNGIGVLPWSPLKGGLLSGKIQRGVKPVEGRMGWSIDMEGPVTEISPPWHSITDQTFHLIETAGNIGKKHGRTTAQVSLRWLLQKDVVSSVVIGPRTLAQLDDNMGAANGWALTKEEMKELDDLSDPRWPYPYCTSFRFNADRINLHVGDPNVLSL